MPAPGQEETVRIVALDRDFMFIATGVRSVVSSPIPCVAGIERPIRVYVCVFINIVIIISGTATSACVHRIKLGF